jgi:CheY-like chemotaxis protein
MRILAVDDEPFILELMPLLAAKVGFPHVTVATSGRMALDLVAGSKVGFDCFVLDINMPEMDGIELCSKLRQLPLYRTAPVIMLTAMSERDFMDRAFKAGATDFATKPFDIAELGVRLRVAQELIRVRQIAEGALAARNGVGAAPLPGNRLDLSDTISIDWVRDVVDFSSLKNYLAQCSRAGISASQIIAVKIDRIEDIHLRSSADEFAYAITDVAHAIDDKLRTEGCIMSYIGNGFFVIVSNSASPLSSSEVEADVQLLLDERNAQYDNGEPMDLEVSVGNAIQPNFGESANFQRSIGRAIARAESRQAEKQNRRPSVNIRAPLR